MVKTINKTYKYRIYPTKQQEEMFSKYFGCVRFVYNHFLAERQNQYKETGKSDNYYKQASTLTILKKQEEYNWLKEVNSQTLQCALRHLEVAYTNFFLGRAKFPKFKKKKDKNSFSIPQNVFLSNNKLIIPKFKDGIKVKVHRELQGKILNATISKTPTNKYFVSITTEQEYKMLKQTNKQIGIDLGIKDLVITSDGSKYRNNHYINIYSKQLAKAQRHLSRKVKGSNQFEKQRLKVAKIHEKISNCRKDTLHKITSSLIKNYSEIYLEDLNVSGMLKNHKLAKSISDVGFYELTRQFHYKGEWNDRLVYKVKRFYPSSKTCNKCGYIKEDLTLQDRFWECPQCHTHHDRDINASINILQEGIREINS